MLELRRVKRRSVACALLVLLAVFAGCARRAAPTRSVTFQDIFAEDSIPENHGQRVAATGVVLYSDPVWHLLILQDSTGGVYIAPPADMELHAGDQLQVTGELTDPGHLLANPEFKVLASGKMPEPVKLQSVTEIKSNPTRFVQTDATVRWAGIKNGRATLEAYQGDSRLSALIYPGTNDSLPRVGSKVRLSGVGGVDYDDNGQFHSWRILVPSSRQIQVLDPGPQDPFTLPLEKLSTLSESQRGKLVHVAGRVSDNGSSVSDSKRTVAVELRRPLRGDFASAEVAGFWSGSAIEDAIICPTGELLAHPGDIRTVSQLKHLSVTEASSRRPVSIR